MAKKRSSSQSSEFLGKQKKRRREILFGSFLMLIGFLFLVSFLSYFYNWQSDQSTLEAFFDRNVQSQNILNKLGALTAHFFIYQLFGFSAFIIPCLLGYTGLVLFFSLNKKRILHQWSWALCYMTCLMIFLGFYQENSPILSGLVGFEVNDFLVSYLVANCVFTIIFILVVQWA